MSAGHDLTIMTNDKLLSQTISYLRFPLTVGVVFIHFNLSEKGLQLGEATYGINHPDWYFCLMQFFSNVLPRIAVPLFFFISGFLFFSNTEFGRDAYKRKLYTRARTLLVPYLLWNAITLLQKSARVFPGISSLAGPAKGVEFHFSLVRLFNTFFNYDKYNGILVTPVEDAIAEVGNASYPIDVPMWYLRDLMVVILLAPVIYWAIKNMGKWFVVAVGIVKYCIMPVIMPEGGYPAQFVTALFFISWGAYFSISRQSFVETMRKFKYIPLAYLPIAIIDALTKRTDYNFYFHNLGILLGLVSAIIIASYLVEKKRVNLTLANASFFIYAFHMLLLRPVGRMIIMVFHLPDSTSAMLMLYVVTPIITIILCLITYKLLKKYIPSVCNLLTGGR